MITLPRKQAQELLDLLEYFNQFSLPPHGFAIPAEIDDLMDALRVRLAEPWTPDDTAYRPGGLPQPEPSLEQDIAVYGMRITKNGKRIDPASIYKKPVAKWEPQIKRTYSSEGLLLSEKIKYTPDGEWQDFPPQREWQGLTEQEHANIAVEAGCASADWVFYGAAVERALKEKNT